MASHAIPGRACAATRAGGQAGGAPKAPCRMRCAASCCILTPAQHAACGCSNPSMDNICCVSKRFTGQGPVDCSRQARQDLAWGVETSCSKVHRWQSVELASRVLRAPRPCALVPTSSRVRLPTGPRSTTMRSRFSCTRRHSSEQNHTVSESTTADLESLRCVRASSHSCNPCSKLDRNHGEQARRLVWRVCGTSKRNCPGQMEHSSAQCAPCAGCSPV